MRLISQFLLSWFANSIRPPRGHLGNARVSAQGDQYDPRAGRAHDSSGWGVSCQHEACSEGGSQQIFGGIGGVPPESDPPLSFFIPLPLPSLFPPFLNDMCGYPQSFWKIPLMRGPISCVHSALVDFSSTFSRLSNNEMALCKSTTFPKHSS